MFESIKNQCLKLPEESGIIIALLDDNDTGVIFEAGFARSLNKPVILVSTGSCSGTNAMLIGSAVAVMDNVLNYLVLYRSQSI